ncbi:Rv2175c family DNA-binding protein [Nocardioides sp. B-3]|uniref:Rv2175c family DNA-binding protein n=1 Tax=Nocardioides sp. B-3 TaxID=2895565 RepID=UPI0021532F89|nr:Rv2175c family DNA-binding protein [Nocardioides sp. B-3]UUZ59675.1 transcriptional regulator [Nocardioides sp. B-3]
MDEWLDWNETAAVLGVTPAKVRTMIKDHEIAAAVPKPGMGPSVPAAFFRDGLIVKGLSGLLTMLHDRHFDDREIIARIFTEDDYPGRPIDAAREPRHRGQAARAGARLLTRYRREP